MRIKFFTSWRIVFIGSLFAFLVTKRKGRWWVCRFSKTSHSNLIDIVEMPNLKMAKRYVLAQEGLSSRNSLINQSYILKKTVSFIKEGERYWWFTTGGNMHGPHLSLEESQADATNKIQRGLDT